MKIFKLMMLALVAMVGLNSCSDDCNHDFIEHDFTQDIVGTWTILEENQAEAMVIKADGSFTTTGVMKGGALYEEKGTIKVVNNKVTLAFDGDNETFEGRLEFVAGKSMSIVMFDNNDVRLTYDYCENDLADEIVGMWVCNDGPMAGDDDMTIQTFKADGTSIITGIGPSGDKGGQITYKIVGDLLFNVMPNELADGVSRYSCSRIVYSPNGTALGDIMSHTSYFVVEDFEVVKSTVSWIRVKQNLNLTGKRYEYSATYLSNVKGEDKDIPFFDSFINFAKLDEMVMDMFLNATLFSVHFPNANTLEYGFRMNGGITTTPAPIVVEGNKMTIKMSANNAAYRDVVVYAYQDQDDSQFHMYMPTTSFENFFGNMQVELMDAKGQLVLTDEAAVKAVFDSIEAAVESINVSFVLK